MIRNFFHTPLCTIIIAIPQTVATAADQEQTIQKTLPAVPGRGLEAGFHRIHYDFQGSGVNRQDSCLFLLHHGIFIFQERIFKLPKNLFRSLFFPEKKRNYGKTAFFKKITLLTCLLQIQQGPGQLFLLLLIASPGRSASGNSGYEPSGN